MCVRSRRELEIFNDRCADVLVLFRQMMQHLHRLHHVEGWLHEQGHVDLPRQQLLQKVEQLRQSKKDVQGKVRVIADVAR